MVENKGYVPYKHLDQAHYYNTHSIFLNDIYFIRHLHCFALRMYVALKSHKYENALARMFYYCCDILMMRVVNDAHAYHGLQYVFTRI